MSANIPLMSHQMAIALNALSPIALRINVNGKWYVEMDVLIKNEHTESGLGAFGETPEDAIRSAWETVTKIPDASWVLVCREHQVRWNGFMWVRRPGPAQFKPDGHS